MNYYDQMDYEVQQQVYDLKAYAVTYRDGSIHRAHSPMEYAREQLRAALVKDQVETFVPIREQFEELSISLPATGWEYFKTMLPQDLRFGWLRPQYKVNKKQVPNKTTITINSYNVYVAPNDRQIVVAKMPNFKIDRRFFREVRAT
jgi:hypothetical protein